MSYGDKRFTTAVILAGGSGSRFGSDIPKQLASVCGKTVLRRTVEAFYDCDSIDKIVIVTRPEDVDNVKKDLNFASDKIHAFVTGGNSRLESAKRGFLCIPKETDYVAIHDAARCMITPEDISLVLTKACETGAATAAKAINDTVKMVDSDVIINTVPRENLVLAETPQIFAVPLYEKAINGADCNVTDDNMLVEKIGIPISAVILGHPNVKVTTKDDLEFVEFLLSKKDENASSNCRIGQGYDVHRLVDGRKLILGGVDIPFDKGLLGHSDADVLIHAVMDALLGAMGLGDIGRHFPDTAEKYRGISSIELLREVSDMLDNEGFEVVNIDSTVVLQSPRISPYIGKMQENISDTLKIPQSRVNIKATTEERLGFTGRGEGAKAEAVALIRKK